jgi:hypothetical protein
MAKDSDTLISPEDAQRIREYPIHSLLAVGEAL